MSKELICSTPKYIYKLIRQRCVHLFTLHAELEGQKVAPIFVLIAV
ncbi:MAG: hypothetical protein K0R08_1161 [Solimicrobium sp.]|jgi:hypothetical protein|nr:hypothetical protein [Solimicrobium sp.]